ncbi:MAG: hypothetical protein HXY30_08370 [Pseudorhodoplanes sp.]|nr:hypothetical protein [Pseudorhodoplanes sp.]
MKKALIAVTTAAAIAGSSIAVPMPAYAGSKSGAVAAGVIGGLAAGAIIGGAIASQPRYVAPAYGGPVYVAPPPRMCIQQERYWSNRRQAWIIRDVQVPC